MEIGENIVRLYLHPYKPLPLLLPRKGIYPDKHVITKQACRDESRVYLFFPLSQYISHFTSTYRAM